MILTTASEQTKKLTPAQVSLLRNECNDVRTAMEAGWLIIMGWKDDKQLVLAHCDSHDEFDIRMGLKRPSSPWQSYSEDCGYLFAIHVTSDQDNKQRTLFMSSDERWIKATDPAVRQLLEDECRDVTLDENCKIETTRLYWDQLPKGERPFRFVESRTPKP